ncbi:MAG: polyprenyl synthetase family protein [Phycisphaeraceae bacterium]|nr:MAG: polyprenyl synthetase family protein [Phycisphaeraceae bacterium]
MFPIPTDLADSIPGASGVADALASMLQRVDEVFRRELTSDLPPVRDLTSHVESYRGKMLRPTLVGLCGLAAHPAWERNPKADPAAMLTDAHAVVAATVEMVHMATLVHDDVLDEADVRRRGRTVNRLYGNEPAVILGDYLIASAYHLCASLPSPGPARAIGRAAMITAAGELLQLHHRGNLSLDEPTYDEIIRGKTAELIATACELGASLSGAGRGAGAALADFGHAVGSAFQIQDDLLDLTGREAVVGKSVGKDLEKGKLTLPVIHHLRACGPTRRGASLALIGSFAEGRSSTGDPDMSRALLDAVRETGSIEYATARARAHVEQAVRGLETLPVSPARSVLEAMARAVVGRDH